jgi:hypothetical protein
VEQAELAVAAGVRALRAAYRVEIDPAVQARLGGGQRGSG